MDVAHDPLEQNEPTRRNWFSFVSLMVMQVQNAFNDKAIQFLLVALGAAIVKETAESAGVLAGNMEYVLAGLIVTPFILLAPIAGWVGDRFSKTKVIRFSAWFQLGVLSLLVWSAYQGQVAICVGAFFLLAIQSTFLSPAKMGIIKELVGTRKLAFASGLIEMGTILAILLGSILMSFWYDARKADLSAWGAFEIPVVLVLFLAPLAIIGAYGIEKTEAKSQEKFTPRILTQHFTQLSGVLGNRVLRLSAFGVAFFWTFGGFVQLVSVQISKEQNLTNSAGEGTSLAWMMLAAGIGIAVGSLMASLLSKRGIELGLVPVGGVIMVIGTVAMGLSVVETSCFYAAMFTAGAGAAMFLVPVNATLQDSCDPRERAHVLAGSNLLNCGGGLSAVTLQLGLQKWGVGVGWQFVIFGTLSAAAVIYATRLLPQHVLRFVVLSALRLIYRVKVVGAEKIPEKGGVLMVANHVTYIDAFILSAASPRPIRFLMFDGYFKRKGIVRWFVKTFNTVPISRKRAKEALSVAAEAVEEGAVVCIFPEGQLTRSGMMNEIKRGFEMIARKANCPILPAYMDGLWGSIFSFERGRFLKKWPYKVPYGVSVAFVDPLPPRGTTAVELRHQLLELSSQAFAQREVLARPATVLRRLPKVIEGDVSKLRQEHDRLKALPTEQQRFHLTNALQLTEGHGLRRGAAVAVDLDSLEDLRATIALCLPVLHRLKVVVFDRSTSAAHLSEWLKKHQVAYFFGDDTTLETLKKIGAQGALYHIQGEYWDLGELQVYPIGVADGAVLAFSSAHPDAITATQQFQPGWKEKSVGRLLPGYAVSAVNDTSGGLDLSCAASGRTIHYRGYLDEDGFLFPHAAE